MPFRLALLTLVLATGAPCAAADAAGDVLLTDLGARGRLALAVPPGWTSRVEPAEAPALPTLRLGAPDGRALLIATVLDDQAGAVPFDTPDRIDAVVTRLAAPLRPSSDTPIAARHPIAGAGCSGAWAGVAPAGPFPGEAPPATSVGVVRCSRVSLVFTLQTPSLDAAEHAAAIRALASARTD